MPASAKVQKVYCDEAGYTGNDLLTSDQPHFALALKAFDFLFDPILERRGIPLFFCNFPYFFANLLFQTTAAQRNETLSSFQQAVRQSDEVSLSEFLNSTGGSGPAGELLRSTLAFLSSFAEEILEAYNLQSLPHFVSSSECAGIQLADVVAGACAAFAKSPDDSYCRGLGERLSHALGESCFGPDPRHIDLGYEQPFVGLAILRELIKRARDDEPLERDFASIVSQARLQYRLGVY